MDNGTDETNDDPILTCTFQNGSLSVYDTHLEIDRVRRSNYDDKLIEMDDVIGVKFHPGILTGHLQIEEHGVEPDHGGRITHPVDENTLYVPRSKRQCAKRAREMIRELVPHLPTD